MHVCVSLSLSLSIYIYKYIYYTHIHTHTHLHTYSVVKDGRTAAVLTLGRDDERHENTAALRGSRSSNTTCLPQAILQKLRVIWQIKLW